MKAYKFTIHAIGDSPCGYPMSTLYVEQFEGSLESLAKRVKAVKAQLLSERTFQAGQGFSIGAWLNRGQHKPAGYDKRRRERCDNFIAA